MKNLFFTLVAVLSLSAYAFASSPTPDLVPKIMKICITVHGGYELVCIKVVVKAFQGSIDELNLTGKIDARTNQLNLTGFPRGFNSQIFDMDEDTRLRPADKDGETFILKSGTYKINEGRSSILMAKGK